MLGVCVSGVYREAEREGERVVEVLAITSDAIGGRGCDSLVLIRCHAWGEEWWLETYRKHAICSCGRNRHTTELLQKYAAGEGVRNGKIVKGLSE